jgi:hypothetical protein
MLGVGTGPVRTFVPKVTVGFVMAPVADSETGWDWAVMEYPREPMGLDGLVGRNAEDAVPLELGIGPTPAPIVQDVDLGAKPLLWTSSSSTHVVMVSETSTPLTPPKR